MTIPTLAIEGGRIAVGLIVADNSHDVRALIGGITADELTSALGFLVAACRDLLDASSIDRHQYAAELAAALQIAETAIR